MTNEIGAFEKETLYRSLVEAARYWVIEHFLRTGELPDALKCWVYSGGPNGIDWGNPPGPDNPELQPLRRKRIEITMRIVDNI